MKKSNLKPQFNIMQATKKFNVQRAKRAFNGKNEMRELKPETQKKILWLFAQTFEKRGVWCITDSVLPTLVVSTDFDLSRSNEEQPVVELTIEEKGTGGWKMRLLLIKVIGKELPQICPQMYKDDDWGLMHVLAWTNNGETETPDLLHPSQPAYDTVCGIVNARIADAWSRRKNLFPILKTEK